MALDQQHLAALEAACAQALATPTDQVIHTDTDVTISTNRLGGVRVKLHNPYRQPRRQFPAWEEACSRRSWTERVIVLNMSEGSPEILFRPKPPAIRVTRFRIDEGEFRRLSFYDLVRTIGWLHESQNRPDFLGVLVTLETESPLPELPGYSYKAIVYHRPRMPYEPEARLDATIITGELDLRVQRPQDLGDHHVTLVWQGQTGTIWLELAPPT